MGLGWDGNESEFTDEGEKVVAVSCIGQAVRLWNDFKDLKQLISLNVGFLRIYSGNKVQDWAILIQIFGLTELKLFTVLLKLKTRWSTSR